MVEHNLAMVGVASSTLVSRSIFLLLLLFSSLFSITIKEALNDRLLEKHPNIQINALQIQTPKNVPSDISSYNLDDVTITSLRGNDGGAKAAFSKENKEININFKFEMSAKIPVLVAKTDIQKTQSVDASNAALELIDFNDYEQTMLLEMPTKKSTKHNIKANTPIRANNLIEPKDVLKGSVLAIEVRDGGVLVESSAVASSDGNIGEIIEVRQGSLRQRARIISKTKAIIE